MKVQAFVGSTLVLAAATTNAAAQSREPAEIWLGVGLGDAVCADEAFNRPCPAQRAITFTAGGAWRFHPHWAVGGELSAWDFRVHDDWRGTLANPATDTSMSAVYAAPMARWYWFGQGSVDAYLHTGIGFGRVVKQASNDQGSYESDARGLVIPFGMGVEWYVARSVRLGPQLHGFVHLASEVCENQGQSDRCHDAADDDHLLPWRFIVSATMMF